MRAPIDYETTKMITFDVEAEDQAIYEQRLKSKCKVQIHIIDVNDCWPCFEIYDSENGNYICVNKLKQQISIMENLKPNTTIHEFKVKDEDTNVNQLKLSLIESEFSSSFRLNSATGKLKLIKNLDREINERIELLIKVSDGLQDAFSRLIIKIDDTNDNVPIWNTNVSTIHIAENMESGTSLLKLLAVDFDSNLNGQVHYEITSVLSDKPDNSESCDQMKFCDRDACYKIEQNQLMTNYQLDYENERSYEINLTAIDYYGLRSEVLSVRIEVDDVIDCTPKFKRTADEEAISIFENIKIGSIILSDIPVTDCDQGDQLTYELMRCHILGTYYKRCPLDLDNKTGKLTTIDHIDYEEIKRINLKIKVTDLQAHSAIKEFSILVENLNDNSPKITTSTSFVIYRQQAIERNEILAQLQGVDLDRDRIVYRISPELNDDQIESSAVYMDENDGFIYAKNRIEQNIEIKFPVVLIDEHDLFTNELISVLVLITNKTNTADTIDLTFDVFENSEIGSLIHKFKCNQHICKYYLNTCNKLFNIDENGELKVESNLDREQKSTYYFEVYSIGLQIQMFKIRVNILDRNDNSPRLIGNSNERIIRVKENERLKSVIFDLTSIVTDFDLNTQFQFNQINSSTFTNQTRKSLKPYENPFLIESNSGKIILTRELDREKEEKYQLDFSISDGLFKIIDQITIMVTDINDNVPYFESTYYSFNVSERTMNRSIIGKVEAMDKDSNAILRYKIVSEQEDSPFKINEKTGNIYSVRPIDYEQDNHLYISVCQVSDGEFTSTTVLYFNILNENDHEPLFERTVYKFVLNDSVPVDSELFCVRAKDEDGDRLIYKMHDNDDKEYQIFDSSSEEFFFNVQNETGCVRLLKEFKSAKRDHFRFIVSVSDQQYHDFATVQVQVIRLKSSTNDRSLKIINRNNSTIKLNENTSIGQSIYKFTENVQLIDSNHPSVPFKINSIGELILINKIDRSQYHFQLRFDRSIQNITIVVIPERRINEPLIRFERTQYDLQVHEDHKLSRPIIELQLMNVGQNDLRLDLHIMSGNLDEQFLLSKNQLMLTRSLDYEKIKRYSLGVKAINLETNESTEATINVNVINVIEKRPIFLNTPYSFKWCENTVGELGRFVAKSEHDSSLSHNLKYLLKNNQFDYFNLETNTGVLNVIKEIDRESLKSPTIQFKILVIDELNANLQNEAIVSIEIENLNDNHPVWSEPKYEINLIEQVQYSKGYSLINLTAHDLDNDSLIYKIVGSKNDQFALNSSTGELYLIEKTTFDREQESEYILIIEANDGEFKTICELSIHIQDINDQVPTINKIQSMSYLVKKEFVKDDLMKVSIPYQYFTSESTMAENEQLFLFGINAIDLDEWNTANSKINFKFLQSSDTKKLKLNEENGVLTIQNLFAGNTNMIDKIKSLKVDLVLQDNSSKNSLQSKVRVDIEFYDLSSLKWITIFEPVINEILVSENAIINSTIHEFKLLRDLSDTVSLRIVGGDYDNRFKVVQENSTKFKLILDRKIDFEYVQNYLIYLEATSKGVNFQILEMNIKLINEDDNKPQFSKEIYNATILEEQEPNQFVIQLEAFDLDNQMIEKSPEVIEEDDFNADSNTAKQSDFRFEILTENVPFRVDSSSGAVFTTDKIDREESGDLFELQIQVVDNGGLRSQAKLNIHVLDINDNPSRFSTLFRANVSENAKIGSFIIQITFNDRDKPTANSTHKFSISDNRFTIDQQTGRVYLAQQLDCDSGEDEIEAVVTINDGEWNQDTVLTVHIEDENDQRPEFRGCRTHFQVDTTEDEAKCVFHFELNDKSSSVGIITAIDSDKFLNSIVSYKFTEESDLFKIDRQTGEIFKTQSYHTLQHKPPVHKITIQACDHGALPQCNYAKVYLTMNQNQTIHHLPTPIDLANGTVLYRSRDNNLDAEAFGFCSGTAFSYQNQSLVLIGKLELGQIEYCQFWSLFESQKFTNLKIIATKRNLFEPQFLTSSTNNQQALNETTSNHTRKHIYQFRATDNDSNDGFNNEISFQASLISVKYNPNALSYYLNRLKNEQENELFFARSVEWLISNSNTTKQYLDPFVIDSKSGVLYLDHPLDYELITSYKYQITIKDNAVFDQKNSTQLFNIHVLNLNDNDALFVTDNGLTNILTLSIKENNPPNQLIEKLTITDFDDPNCCSMKNFPILSSADSANFELDQSGQLKALISFNYETKNMFELMLAQQNLKIKIFIQDQSEFRPKFTNKQFEFNLLEQTKLNTIIANLNHTIDNQSVNYELQLLKPIDFGISLLDNNLIVSDEIDFERFSMNEIYKQTQQDNVSISVIRLKFTLLVKLKDKLVINPLDFDRTELLINLIDLNEPPKFIDRSTIDCLLVRTNGECSYQFVNECRLIAQDYDANDYVRYRLLNHNHLFSIDEQKGTISLISCNLTNLFLNLPPDNSYLDIMAIDSSDLQSRARINIKLNWRSRGLDPIYTLNDHNATVDRELLTSWCSKGKLVPESTGRMKCYRKTVDNYCCQCQSNYQGAGDCANEDLCASNECENGGLCKQINSRERVCLCRKEYRGARCEQALNQLCTGEKASKCGVNGVCEIVKPFDSQRCKCLDDHTFGHECNSFSLGMRPFSFIRLNVSLNEVNDEVSMTFASFYRMNNQQANEDFGQLMLYNSGPLNSQTGRTDFIALELYERYLLLRLGGSQQSKFVELKVYANKHDLLDGRYYKFSLIRNRKIAHISIYSCSRIYLDNQLNCNNLLNQSSISYNQPSFRFNSNPLFVGGLDFAYGSNKIFAQNVQVFAKGNFVGCLYKATMNGVKINEYIAEKSFVDPICRPSLIHQQTISNISQQTITSVQSNQQANNRPLSPSSINDTLMMAAKKQVDCHSFCGRDSVYCKQNWFEIKCGCTVQINNQTNTYSNIVYESGQPCNSLCEIQLHKKSLVKLRLSEKWNTIMKSETYKTKLEEFILRYHPTGHSSSHSNLWTNGYLSIRISSNGTFYLVNEENQFEQFVKLNGNFKLNQWNTFIIKSTGELYINDQLNRFNSQLFKNNLKSMIIGGELTGCISHIIINGHLVLNNNEHLYELHTENVNGFGCRSIFEFSKLNLDAISIGVILIIMFFVILLLVISTSFMLFNNGSKRKTTATHNRRSTLPNSKHHHFHTNINKTITPHHSLTQMIGNNSYSSQDYYEEPFYYGSDHFQFNEKLAQSNQFNSSSRSQF